MSRADDALTKEDRELLEHMDQEIEEAEDVGGDGVMGS